MYNHTLTFQTEQQARRAERALMYTSIDCSNVHVSSPSWLSFQTTYRLEELARLALRSELEATDSTFNVWEAPYEAGLRASDGRQPQARLVSCQPGTSFTEPARTVLRLAEAEARRFQHDHIGTEHLLLALIGSGEGIGALVLASLGIDLPKVRHAVAIMLGHGYRSPSGSLPLTPRAQRVIKLAVQEACLLNHDATSTEHLLLGLVREGEGMGALVIESLEVSLEKVHRQTLQAASPFGIECDEQSLNGCPYCGENDEEEEATNDIIGDVLFGLSQLAKFLVGAAFCLVATLLLLFFAIVARFILFLLEL